MGKLLLHSCCGPCFLGSFEGLKNSGFEITNYYYNPNIQPKEEYQKRLEGFIEASKEAGVDTIIEDYDPGEHTQAIKGREHHFPKRCLDCYKLRLLKTAKRAKACGFECFSTTLLVSPYQQHDELKEIGETVGKEVGISFYYQDLRPYFREGQSMARKQAIYRQKYCGCDLSLKETGR